MQNFKGTSANRIVGYLLASQDAQIECWYCYTNSIKNMLSSGRSSQAALWNGDEHLLIRVGRHLCRRFCRFYHKQSVT